MFALDLFNTDHERRLAEGAVDKLEQRRIDDLAMKMDDLVARAKDPAYKKNPAALAALMKEFQKCKAERDSYYKVRNETMGYGSLGEEDRVVSQNPTPVNTAHDDARSWKREILQSYAKLGRMRTEAMWALENNVYMNKDQILDFVEQKSQDPSLSALEYMHDLGHDVDGLFKNVTRFLTGAGISPAKIQSIQNKINKQMGEINERRLPEEAQAKTDDALRAHWEKLKREKQSGTPSSVPVEKIPGKADLLKGKGRSYYEGDVTPVKGGVRHHAKPGTYGGYEPEADPLARLDKHAVNRADKAMGVKFDREKKYQGGLDLDVDEAGIPGSVPTEKIPGKEDLLKGKGRSYYEAQTQKKNSEEVDEGQMGEIDAMRQDLERMNDRQFYTAYGLSKAAFQQKYRTLLKPALDEHGGGIGPKQHWQDLMQERKLSVGDPVVVTGANEFEGKTGEVAEFSPSGTFVIVDLYNHGRHSMHLSDIAYNEYADQEQDEEDDWYDDADEFGKPGSEFFPEGWSDAMVSRRTGQSRTPYSVYIKGKKWKDFENDDHAEAVANKLRAKFKAEGRDPSVITIAPTDMSEEEQKPGFGEFPPKQEITIIPPKKLKSGQTYQDQNKYWQSQGQAPIYKTNEEGKGTPVPAKEFARGVLKDLKKVNVKEGIVASGPSKPLDDRAVRKLVWDTMKINADSGDQAIQRALSVLAKKPQSRMVQDLQDKFQNLADRLSQGVAEAQLDELSPQTLRSYIKKSKGHSQKYDQKGNKADEKGDEELANKMWNKGDNRYAGAEQARAKLAGVDEGQTDYSKRRARERDVDAGKPVSRQPKNPQTDYAKKRAQDKKNMELGENQDTSGVERAILNRIMVSHTDLLMKFGPEKVMQAAEEVAYNVGDVDEIGTSDVSAYVAQVKQILGVPQEVNEKWSQKYKSSINCANPKGFSQRAHCAGKKK